MAKPNIEKVPGSGKRALPVFAEFDEVVERIRARAHELFAEHGFGEGRDLEHWYKAEREICWPTAELLEEDKYYISKIALAGFEAKDITVTATPNEVIAKAATTVKKSEPEKKGKATIRWSEFRSEDVYRRIEMPGETDVASVSADFKNGILTVKAIKADAVAKPASKKKKAKKKTTRKKVRVKASK